MSVSWTRHEAPIASVLMTTDKAVAITVDDCLDKRELLLGIRVPDGTELAIPVNALDLSEWCRMILEMLGPKQ